MMNINKAEYAGDYKLRLLFNNGMEGTANLRNTVFKDKRPVFLPLQDKSNFMKFKVEHNTVVWFNELDLAPEFLFYLTFKDVAKYQNQFRQWGYDQIKIHGV